MLPMKHIKYLLGALALFSAALTAVAKDDVTKTKGPVTITEPIHATTPDYPTYARERGITGTVIVECLVDEKGTVYAPSVLNKDAVDPSLAAAAIESVKTWTFSPPVRDGVSTYAVVRIPLVFNLVYPEGNPIPTETVAWAW